MSDYNPNTVRPLSPAAADMSVDVGLRSFMLGVYNKLALGLVLSAALAFVTSSYAPVTNLLYRIVDGGYPLTGDFQSFGEPISYGVRVGYSF